MIYFMKSYRGMRFLFRASHQDKICFIRLPFDLHSHELLGAVGQCPRATSGWVTIQTASLASPELLLTSQKLLFEHLSIPLIITYGGISNADRLDGLAKTPHLLTYVRNFRLKRKESPMADMAHWVSKHGELLVQVLKIVPLEQLEVLCLVDFQDIYLGRRGESESLELSSIRDRLREALHLLLEVSFIRYLSVKHYLMKNSMDGVYRSCAPLIHGDYPLADSEAPAGPVSDVLGMASGSEATSSTV
ncbi:hypothetical protein BKA70DRAFT_1235754 [Coprinopsis sp. MPI-PUGE-AT-0042]|nr:hypothetical protein BKA70DRAFT_1235754 [Coprinopsis sp. MPI-PUGE-AT-0042]